jgi:MFS family permease
LINFLIFFGFNMVATSLAVYLEWLGAIESLVGWIIASTTIAAVIVRPVVGMAVDRWGRRGIFFAGIIFLALTVIAIPFFPFLAALLAIRTLMGIAWGITNTGASTVAADLIPQKRFGEGIGYFGLSNSVSMTIAPALSLTIFDVAGISPVMAIAAGSILLALIIAMTLKYRSGQTKAERAIKQPLRLFDKDALLPACMSFFVMCAFGGVQTFAALLAGQRGIDGAALFFIVLSCTMLVSRPLCGRLTDKKGYRIPILGGLACLIVGLALISNAYTIPPFMVAAFFLGIGFGGVSPTIQTMAVAGVAPNRRGVATSTYFIGFDGGIAVGSIVAGTIAHAFGYDIMYLLFIILPVITILLYVIRGIKREEASRK